MHAALEFAVAHPALVADWHHRSNTLVVLAARDELALARRCADVSMRGLLVVRFREPDLADALTAAAFEPAAAPWLAHLPLALRREVNT